MGRNISCETGARVVKVSKNQQQNWASRTYQPWEEKAGHTMRSLVMWTNDLWNVEMAAIGLG